LSVVKEKQNTSQYYDVDDVEEAPKKSLQQKI